MFLHPLTFNQQVSLGLKWVSCSQHKDGSYFSIHSETVSLLIRAFSPFTCRVITSRYVFSAILLLVLSLFLETFLLRAPFNISCRTGLVVTTPLSFCLGSSFLSSSILNDSPAVQNEHYWLNIFPIQHIEYTMPLPSALPSLLRNLHQDFPFKLGAFFVLLVFKTFLSLYFENLITMYLGIGLLLLILMGVVYAPWMWIPISFPRLGKFSTIISSN